MQSSEVGFGWKIDGNRSFFRAVEPISVGLLAWNRIEPIARFVHQIGDALDVPFQVFS